MRTNKAKSAFWPALLAWLESHSGQTVPWEALSEVFTGNISRSARKKDEKARGKQARKRGSKHVANAVDDRIAENLLPLLKRIEALQLVRLGKDSVVIASPFKIEATISVARTGIAFAQSDSGEEIFIAHDSRKNARHRDRVLVRLLPEMGRGKFEGRIEKVIEPFASEFLARIIAEKDKLFLLHLPDTPDESYGLLEKKRGLKVGNFLIAQTTEKRLSSPIRLPDQRGKGSPDLPLFRFRSILDADSLQSDMTRVALRFQLPLEYPKKAVPSKREVAKLEKIGMAQKSRRDLRKLYSCTIDGDDAKDFDDALSFEKDGNIRRLYVHIADVSHYVQPGTALDKEALRRGNSSYLTTLVIPMLPTILSEEYCSLKPNTDRLAFTCEMEFNENCDMVNYRFYKSIIHLADRYTYSKAEKELDSARSPLKPVWQLASALIEKRNKSGRIDLNIRELENIVDSHGRLTAIMTRERLRSHRLVEECMLSANTATAHFANRNRIPMLHRVHEPISIDRMDKINAFLQLFGFSLRLRSLAYSEIRRALEAVKGSKYEQIFHYLLLRSFTQAVYQRESKGHWGLAFEDYTHFTSPIRRYSDLIVHRHLQSFLDRGKYIHSNEELDYFGRETSRLERISMEAERTMLRLLAVRFLRTSVGKEFEGWLTGFSAAGLFVNIADPMVEGFIPAASFGDRGETLSVDDFRVVLPKFSKTVALGTKFRLKLEECSWEKMQLVFRILSIAK